MKQERILAHQLSRRLELEELEQVSAAGGTSVVTSNATYSRQGGVDVNADVNIDM